jgi:glyoxylase-like metal-dependent hydrolase (beta-lactamase superfamily II)
MKITTHTGGFTQTNGYLIETGQGALLIDAPEGIAEWLEGMGVSVSDLLLTHQHYDHVVDAAALQRAGVRIHAFAAYSPELTLETAARAWGMPISVATYHVDSLITAGRPLSVAGVDFLTDHVPGHSPDSLVFRLVADAVVFSGDTLFAGSIGRTDLPGGSTRQLLDGISRHLLALPPETRVLSGHGPATTIGRELDANPYLG